VDEPAKIAESLYFLRMQDGYTDVPPGKIANVVTYLEMRSPLAVSVPRNTAFAIRLVDQPELEWYRRLFREIGEPWLWFIRLRITDDELRSIIRHPAVDIFALSYEGADRGLLEFDRRGFPEIEVAYFGVTPGLIGKGAGSALFAHGLAFEWQRNPQRIFLHTCTADHPSALRFYQRFGFVPYKRAIEIADDPRLTGEIPRAAAPHLPIIGDLPRNS
jgi:GNAT superfamily N-acetyltransferase